jgi:hypothetical protein
LLRGSQNLNCVNKYQYQSINQPTNQSINQSISCLLFIEQNCSLPCLQKQVLVSVPRFVSAVHVAISSFFEIRSNIILCSTSSKRSHLLKVLGISVSIFLCPIRATCPVHFMFCYLIVLVIIMKLLNIQYFVHPCHSSFLCQKVLLRFLSSNTPSLCPPPPNMRNKTTPTDTIHRNELRLPSSGRTKLYFVLLCSIISDINCFANTRYSFITNFHPFEIIS